MSWTALVPLKGPGGRKERLAAKLSAADRDDLTARMFEAVLAALQASRSVARIVVLSPDPPGPGIDWIADEGRGLNPELEAARVTLGAPLLIVHADLPRLTAADVDALTQAAEGAGIAIAPDEAGQGTNALAMMPDLTIACRFGIGSFRLHCAQAPGAAIVRRPGLAFDIDEPAQLDRL